MTALDRAEIARRTLLAAIGLAPVAAFGPRPAWAAANTVTIRIEGEWRRIESNAIPDHAAGAFPNSGNPHRILPQTLSLRVTTAPRETGRALSIADRHMFGVALNGVPFDPLTAEFWRRDRNSGWREEASTGMRDLGLDSSNAHVQPNGMYHYHGLPRGLVERLSAGAHGPLIGWAADGFPIYAARGYADPRDPSRGVRDLAPSWRLKSGRRPDGPGGVYDGTYVQDFGYAAGSGDLDQNNGRRGVTPEFPQGTYAYFITSGFPAVPHSLAGTPDDSFAKRRGGGRNNASGGGFGGGPAGRRGPPPFSDDRPPPPFGDRRRPPRR